MVKEKKKDNKTYYICEACNFAYGQHNWAEKCEKWCNDHNSCSLEITKYAVRLK